MDPQNVRNEDPQVVTEAVDGVLDVLAYYGWYLLLIVVGGLFVWTKWGRSAFSRWQQSSEEAQRKRDPDAFQAKDEAMRKARERMQRQYDDKAKEFDEQEKEKERKREEERRLNKIEEWERLQEGKGFHSRTRAPSESSPAEAGSVQRKPKDKDNKSLRNNDYNPLTGGGGGGGACFRPSSRRGPSGGGGG